MTELEQKIHLLAKEYVASHYLHEELEAIVRASKEGKLKIKDHSYSTIKGSWPDKDTYHVTLVMDIEVPHTK